MPARQHNTTSLVTNGGPRGGRRGSPTAIQKLEGGDRQVSLRIPEAILSEIDDLVRGRSVRIPRHTWLMEAVVEKLKREKAEAGGDHGAQ